MLVLWVVIDVEIHEYEIDTKLREKYVFISYMCFISAIKVNKA